MGWLILALAGACLVGCGSGGPPPLPYATCGNGTLDPGEACDDGNLNDDDDCLSSCVIATCGDGFIRRSVEQCDIIVSGSCTGLGFGPGPLSCSPLCTIDTSGCGPTPTVTATRTVTPTPAVETSPTPTPYNPCGNGFLEAGETCASCPADCEIGPCTPSEETVQFDVRFDYPLGGQVPISITTLVGYDSELVEIDGTAFAIPGAISMPQAGSAVIGNDLDYALRATQNKAAGFNPPPDDRLYRITFHRCSEAPLPTAASFGCTVEGCADSLGILIDDCTCEVVLP